MVNRVTGLILLAALVTSSLSAQSEIEKIQDDLKVLQKQSDILAEELLDISTGSFTKVDDSKAHSGLGAAASKVYYSSSPLSIGGYGEMFMAKRNSDRAYADIYRFIPYIGYRFSDSVILNAEIEFEHGTTTTGLNNQGKEKSGKVLMEFMYLDFLLSKSVNIRVGNLLVPMGLINLRHEPTLFGTTIRPYVERYLIPSTWHENGLLVYGEIKSSGVEYTVGIVNALNIANKDIGKTKWIRSGRIGSQYNGALKGAFVGRLDYRGINGLLLGGSIYFGDGSNRADDIKDTTMSIVEIHANYDVGGLNLKALYTRSDLDNAKNISSDAASSAEGYYISASYDVGKVANIGYKVPIFVQYENYNLAETKVDGSSTEATSKYNVGVNFFPTDQTVLKVDYEIIDDPSKSKDDKTIYASLGFLF